MGNVLKIHRLTESQRERAREKRRLWVAEDPERARASRRGYLAVRRAKLIPVILESVRSRLRKVTDAGPQYGTPEELVGCSGEELLSHLASQLSAGVRPDDYGKTWGLDHIRPLSDWTYAQLCTPEGQRAAMHWSNTRPMTLIENSKKAWTVDRSSTLRKTRETRARRSAMASRLESA